MNKKPANQPDRIRWPTAFVILVLATIGIVVFWQLVLQGTLARPTPEQVVREFLQLGLADTRGFEIREVQTLRELPTKERNVKLTLLRVRFRARDQRGELVDFDKAVVVTGEQVRSADDWTPELESQIHGILEKLQQK